MNIYNDAVEFYTDRIKTFLSDSKPKSYEEIFVALRVDFFVLIKYNLNSEYERWGFG